MLKILLRIRLQAWLAYMNGTMGGKGGKKSGTGKKLLFGLLYLYLAAVFLFMFFAFFSALAEPFASMGLGWYYFSFFGIMAFALMFVFSVFTAKAQLFEARDNELLLSMPIKPTAILASRMLSLLLLNFGFELLVAVPAAVAWCLSCPVNVGGAVAFVLICLALPFFSLSISALFGWLLAVLTARMRHKTLVSTVFSLAFLGAYLYIYSNINTVIANIVANVEALSGSMGAVLPVLWLGVAVADGDLISLVLCLTCLILPSVLVYFVLSRTFIRTVTTRRGAAKNRYVRREAHVSSVPAALLRREAARLLSSAAYIMNSALGAIMNVVLAVLLLIKGRGLLAALEGMGDISAMVGAVAALALCVMGSMTTISACSVSLEGKNLWIVRSMPVEAAQVLRSKLALHLLVSAPGLLLAQIACIIVLRPVGLSLLWILLLPQLFNLLMALFGQWANLNHPRLDWQTEVQPVKQGAAVAISMFGGWGMLVIPALAGLFMAGLPHGLDIVAAVYLVLVAAMDVLLYKWCMSRGCAIFSSL